MGDSYGLITVTVIKLLAVEKAFHEFTQGDRVATVTTVRAATVAEHVLIVVVREEIGGVIVGHALWNKDKRPEQGLWICGVADF